MRLFGEQFQLGVLHDPITAIVGGASILTGIIGGHSQANAAKSAAQIQADAATKAGQNITDVTKGVNPDILAAAKTAGAGVTDAATNANKLLDPYARAGATAADVENAGIAPGGDFNKTPGMSDLTIDPGYAFREQQGEQALTRSAAAHGGVGGGGFEKDLAAYSQGQASQEYQAAFNRFETSQQNRFANVNAVANAGRVAATTQGGNLIGAGEYAGNADINATNLTSSNTIGAAKTAGDYATQAANATASGKVAASNATWGGITGGINTAAGLAMTRPSANYIKWPWASNPTRAAGPGGQSTYGVG